jgi:DNA-binding response OmpR family regulator|uniref:Response regulator n=1 Tax=Desulfobacca acetoxidans TaxID=60893 RepID=A0A7V6DQL4_9BACT
MSTDKPVLRILIAEDDINLGEALVSYLREKGYAVDLARHGGEALDFLARRDYSLILTDLVMPEADGLEVLRAARQKNPAALVVVMTGHASLTSALKATREGAYDYLRKPFNLQEIEVAVANAARLLHLREENRRLLAKLNELNAKLAKLQQEADYPEADLPPAHTNDRTDPLRNLLWCYPLPWEVDPPHQHDLERLLSLYREKLLTEQEFQILKERILI